MKSSYDQFFKKAKKNKMSSKRIGPPIPAKGGINGKAGDLDNHSEEMLRQLFKVESAKKRPINNKSKRVLSKNKRNSKKSNDDKTNGVVTVILVLFGALLAGYGSIFPEEVESILKSVRVSFVSQSLAKDGNVQEKTTQAKGKDAAVSTQTSASENIGDQQAKKNWTQEDLNYFSKLGERKKELDQRERELAELEEELHKQKTEIEARIKKLEEIRNKISGVLKDRVRVDEEKVNKLVEFYSGMKPKQAAEIVAKINEDLAVEILGRMKKKSAADILNLLEPKKARVLSEKFAGYQRR